MSLRLKAEALNNFIEDVSHWLIILDGKMFRPRYSFTQRVDWWATKHENFHICARVEMYGFGKIYKLIGIGNEVAPLTELFPKQKDDDYSKSWFDDIFDPFFDPPGQDTLLPDTIIFPNSEAWEYLNPPQGIQLIYRAKYWPLDDYVKELTLKRNFMTTDEFKTWADVIDQAHKKVGGKTPNYIKRNPFAQVPETVH